ncbi:MAG: putative DNA binding domain-containing protein [Acholeplasmatales bacterium]|nr:putative DNA binding domain-containing protein [Acholeplasmatales bacterium]
MLRFDETDKYELKEILNDALPKEIETYLNTEGGGHIYIGVNKIGEVVGITKGKLDETMLKVADVITDQVLPKCTEYVHAHHEVIENKDVIIIDIKRGNKLYYQKKYGMTPKGCHYRVGTKCQEMTPEEIEKRFVATLNVPAPDICEMKSRRQDLSFEVLKIYLKEHRVEFKDEYFDSTFELRNEEGKYNEMAYLLSDQFNESIKVCRFKGKGGNLVMRKEFGNGCLFKIYNEVKDYMQSQENIVKTYFDAGTRRDEYLYNQVAFVEAWKNAILHNNYAEKQYPAIYLFDDHLEVFSNGNPLKNVSFDEFIIGKSRPINRQLTKIAMNIDITDQTGKGNKDIVEIYGKDAFEIMEHTLTVKIPYNKLAMDLNTTSDDAQNDAQNDAQKTLEEKIIFIIKENDKITRIKMAELLGVSKPTIERAIKASNKIKYVGPSKGGHWEIIE